MCRRLAWSTAHGRPSAPPLVSLTSGSRLAHPHCHRQIDANLASRSPSHARPLGPVGRDGIETRVPCCGSGEARLINRSQGGKAHRPRAGARWAARSFANTVPARTLMRRRRSVSTDDTARSSGAVSGSGAGAGAGAQGRAPTPNGKAKQLARPTPRAASATAASAAAKRGRMGQ